MKNKNEKKTNKQTRRKLFNRLFWFQWRWQRPHTHTLTHTCVHAFFFHFIYFSRTFFLLHSAGTYFCKFVCFISQWIYSITNWPNCWSYFLRFSFRGHKKYKRIEIMHVDFLLFILWSHYITCAAHTHLRVFCPLYWGFTLLVRIGWHFSCE